jgi:hypothetical protein
MRVPIVAEDNENTPQPEAVEPKEDIKKFEENIKRIDKNLSPTEPTTIGTFNSAPNAVDTAATHNSSRANTNLFTINLLKICMLK